MAHKFELEKYHGKDSRHECPKCHTKGVFSRYIDTETGRYLSFDVGRCNREDKCGYHYTPKQYFADHPDEKDSTQTKKIGKLGPYKEREKPTVKQINRIPKEYIIKSLGYDSNFVRFLCSLFDHYTKEAPTVQRIMSNYYLGCTQNGSVIFWQIDVKHRIRAGKIMQYNPHTGKRIKSGSGAIDWVHAKLKKSGVLSDDWELSQCLFGEHQLTSRPDDSVCLVESEKSAIIGSAVMPGYIWLATGGKGNLKSDKCECLKGRNVILYPDLGAFDKWREKGETIAREIGFDIFVSDILEKVATDEERANGLDIADYLIRQLKAQTPKCDNLPVTREEKALYHLGNINPNVYALIDILGLVSTSTGNKIRTFVN